MQSPAIPEVTYYDAQVTAVLLGPDGEPLIIHTDERPFGFARWLEEAYDEIEPE